MTNGGDNTILGQQCLRDEATEQAQDGRDELAGADRILVIVGPTAVGKTAVAIELATQIHGEIVSADSMQVYRGMDVGTAKPSQDERERVPFHMIDILSPARQLTVAEWKKLAEEAIKDIRGRGMVPIICGGTGLYVRSLLDDWEMARTPADPGLRALLGEKIAVIGSPGLHSELAEVDPVTAARLHPNDAIRIIRALEVFYSTGNSISEHQASDRKKPHRHAARQFGLIRPRPDLYKRIDERVDQMVLDGLEAEVRQLLTQGLSSELGPLCSLGYKEMVKYINGELPYSEMLRLIKQNTRRYSKRQQTWFRSDKTIEWIDVTALSSATVAGQIASRLETDPQAP